MQDIVSRTDTLPPLPDTALKLIKVMHDPGASMDDIVDAVRYDQAVTGQVLRLCNSAYFGLSRRITSLHEAMLSLGTFKVLQLVMSVHCKSLLCSEQAGYGLGAGVLWRHSVAVAIASSLIGQRLQLLNVNEAFTAGLLHDVGKVVLSEYVADEFAEIMRRVTDEAMSFAEAERNVLGFSHEELGGAIADVWMLPDTIVRCIRFHHTPWSMNPPDTLVDTVYLADSICLLLGIGLGHDGLFYRADPKVLERQGMREHDIEEIGAQMMIELQKVEQSLADVAVCARNGGSAIR